MSRGKCFECDLDEDLHDHHVIPKVLGGTKTIKLCPKCHGLIHNRNFLHHKNLQSEGIKKAKNNGVKFGRPKALNDSDMKNFIGDVIFENLSTRELSLKYKISNPTSRRIKQKINEENNL